MATIQNPILPGFNPDPAICRVGDDIYIATSTFEWWPGVQIHHSKDMVNWRLATRPLTRKSQLDLTGVDDSAGVWAPCLTHAHGLFWLVYTNVQHKTRPWFVTPNYVVTAPSIEGPWSEPLFLNKTGFDPSMFHDDDGKTWVTTMRWNHLPGSSIFDGIVLQEFDRTEGKCMGPIYDIFTKAIGGTEGPHLMKRDGWYYLILAEGGTSWNHAITVARSQVITGPYEVHPDNPMLTSWQDPDNPLQKSGHGGFVELADGSWWTTHLCGRPLPDTGMTNSQGNEILGSGKCILGRETSVQRIEWGEDGWPRLAHGGRFPLSEMEGPDLPRHPWPEEPTSFDFSEVRELPSCFQSPRTPITPEWVDFGSSPKALRLVGGNAPTSRFDQHCIARRITSFTSELRATLDADPRHPQHIAGVMALYDTECWYSLDMTYDRNSGARVLRVSALEGSHYESDLESQVELADGAVDVRLRVDHTELYAYWRQSGGDWQQIGSVMDMGRLCDENDVGNGLNFTGSWFALHSVDACGDGFYTDIFCAEFDD